MVVSQSYYDSVWVEVQMWQQCEKQGTVQTMAGRCYYYPGISAMSVRVRPLFGAGIAC